MLSQMERGKGFITSQAEWRDVFFLCHVFTLTLSLPNATVVEFYVHCQTRLQSKFKGTFNSCQFLTVIRDATLCSLFQNVQGTL